MIKINLLGTQTKATAQSSSFSFRNLTKSSTRAEDSGTADILIKLAVLLIPTVCFYAYQEWNIGEKQNQLNDYKTEMVRVSQELERLKPQVEAVDKFEADKKQLLIRVDTIKKLSKARLKNVKALDAIQNILPSRAWLTRLAIHDNKIDIEGEALEDTDVTQFMQGLEENIFFNNVFLLSTERNRRSDGVVKAFKIEAFLEKI